MLSSSILGREERIGSSSAGVGTNAAPVSRSAQTGIFALLYNVPFLIANYNFLLRVKLNLQSRNLNEI